MPPPGRCLDVIRLCCTLARAWRCGQPTRTRPARRFCYASADALGRQAERLNGRPLEELRRLAPEDLLVQLAGGIHGTHVVGSGPDVARVAMDPILHLRRVKRHHCSEQDGFAAEHGAPGYATGERGKFAQQPDPAAQGPVWRNPCVDHPCSSPAPRSCAASSPAWAGDGRVAPTLRARSRCSWSGTLC